jgi:hypothetical protein
VMDWTFKTAVEQIESCDFECIAGPLANNIAWRWLKTQVKVPEGAIRVRIVEIKALVEEHFKLAPGRLTGPEQVREVSVPRQIAFKLASTSPAHYGGADNPYEAIKVIEAWKLGFCLGNTVKYISRAGKKDSDHPGPEEGALVSRPPIASWRTAAAQWLIVPVSTTASSGWSTAWAATSRSSRALACRTTPMACRRGRGQRRG